MTGISCLCTCMAAAYPASSTTIEIWPSSVVYDKRRKLRCKNFATQILHVRSHDRNLLLVHLHGRGIPRLIYDDRNLALLRRIRQTAQAALQEFLPHKSYTCAVMTGISCLCTCMAAAYPASSTTIEIWPSSVVYDKRRNLRLVLAKCHPSKSRR